MEEDISSRREGSRYRSYPPIDPPPTNSLSQQAVGNNSDIQSAPIRHTYPRSSEYRHSPFLVSTNPLPELDGSEDVGKHRN